MTYFSKDVAAYFFEKGDDIIDGGKKKNVYKCRCAVLFGRECTSKNSAFTVGFSSGFTNLKGHLKDCDPDFEAQYANREKGIWDIRNHVVVDKVTQKIFSWIKWIIEENCHLISWRKQCLEKIQ